MRKATLGRTGLEISELVLGGGVTGGILIKADEATRFAALRRAVMGGINWIDTAPGYGNGASEETIGRHIDSLTPRPQVRRGWRFWGWLFRPPACATSDWR